jgi:hypothetical protein
MRNPRITATALVVTRFDEEDDCGVVVQLPLTASLLAGGVR